MQKGPVRTHVSLQNDSVDLKELFKQLIKFTSENSDERDLQAVRSIVENVRNEKIEVAKSILFDLLTRTVQASAAGVSIAKAFGWL